MVESEKANFAQIIRTIGDYYGKDITPEVMVIYWNGLKDLDLIAIRQALNAHAQNPDSGQFMPRIADVRKMLGGTTQDSALVAWSKVDKAIRCVGTYRDVVFDDPIIHRVIQDMGGYIKLGASEDKEYPFVAKEFESRYRGYKMRGEIPEYPKVLTGISNSHNQKNGFKAEPPTLIGDESKCLNVMIGGTDKPMISISGNGFGVAEKLMLQSRDRE